MQFYPRADILEFFDVSIVMPFFKKVNDFKRVLPANKAFFQRNGIEVVIVMDEDTEELQLKELLTAYPYINWKIIVNRNKHDWRNPCKVLNVGIKHASNRYIFFVDPEVELYTDVIYQLRYILQYYCNSYATGRVIFADFSTEITNQNVIKFIHRPYGSLMVEKHGLESIGGFSESYTEWGGEDDNIRSRLDLAGYTKIDVQEAVAIHREDRSDEHLSRNIKSGKIKLDLVKASLYPDKIFTNDDDWGNEFNEICLDWKKDNKKSLLQELSGTVDKFELSAEDVFDKHYRTIALIPTRNEKAHVPDVLYNLEEICDGIVLLDNGSTDDTYEAAASDKLLLKVKTEYKGYFDDLGNRNLLLKLGHLFNVDWFIFADADERFDRTATTKISAIPSQSCNIVVFKMIHLWNNENYYRQDVPGGRDGVVLRHRMFKNRGFMQIMSNKDVHFRATPYEMNVFFSDILIKNYGFLDPATRLRKYNNYSKLDNIRNKRGNEYQYLLDADPKLVFINKVS